MKIGIYARCLSHAYGGVKEYTSSMIDSIIKNISSEDEIYIVHNLNKKIYSDPRVHEIIMDSTSKIKCDFILAKNIFKGLQLDVIWFPHNTIPSGIKGKKILTIHDLAYFDKKNNYYPLLDSLYMKIMIKDSCKKADKIIAISENTKKDIINYLRIEENKIKVIYESYNQNKFKEESKRELERVRKKYGLNNKFLLFTGGISPRKNLIRLINVFNKISSELNLDLVLTGGEFASWNDKEELNLLNENSRIRKLGYIPEEDLSPLYNLAELYVYPSLYEGFGLPILEAQACGCPVLTSNVTSLPEVGGDSVYYVNSEDEKELEEGIRKIIRDKKLKEELIKKGFENIKRFSWDKAGKELLNVMREL